MLLVLPTRQPDPLRVEVVGTILVDVWEKTVNLIRGRLLKWVDCEIRLVMRMGCVCDSTAWLGGVSLK